MRQWRSQKKRQASKDMIMVVKKMLRPLHVACERRVGPTAKGVQGIDNRQCRLFLSTLQKPAASIAIGQHALRQCRWDLTGR